VGAHSATVDFVDHFRAAGEDFDYTWEERWIRDEGLAKIVPPVIAKVLQKSGISASKITHFIMPSTIGRAVAGIARQAGVPADAVRDNLDAICGETGAAHALVMLLHAVETTVKPGDTLLVVGFGHGCDAIVLRATHALASFKSACGIVAALANRQDETNYQKYLAFNDLIALEKGMRAERDDYKTAMTVTYRKRDMLLGLVGGRCTQCGTLQFPKTDICVNPNCNALHTQEPYPFADMAGRIKSYTADRLTYSPDPPSCYGMIEFEEGGRVMIDFTDIDGDALKVGQPMQMMFRIKDIDTARGFRRYYWKAAPKAGKA